MLARDCVASIRRWAAASGYGAMLMEAADELSAADDKTIVFRLKRSFPLLPDALAQDFGPYCPMMPERLAQTPVSVQIKAVIGSGPYRFVPEERISGSRTVWDRFDKYQPRDDAGGPDFTSGPKLSGFDRIEWTFIPDAGTAAALQRGEMDGWEFALSDLLPGLIANPTLKAVQAYAGRFTGYLRPNHAQPPFNNPAIRRAVLARIRQADFMIAAMGDNPSQFHVPSGFFPSGTPLENSPATNTWLRGNGEQPASLSGWPVSPRLEELQIAWRDAPDDAARKSIAVAMQAQAFEDVPYMPRGQSYPTSVYRADMEGIVTGFPIFGGMRRA